MNDHNNTNDLNDAMNMTCQPQALTCADVSERLGDYLEGDLPPQERQAVDRHLSNCTECTTFLAGYKHVIEAAAELREPEQPVSVDVQNRLREALNRRLGINLPYIA